MEHKSKSKSNKAETIHTRMTKIDVINMVSSEADHMYLKLTGIRNEIERIRAGQIRETYMMDGYDCPGDTLDDVCRILSNPEAVKDLPLFGWKSILRELSDIVNDIYHYYDVFNDEIMKLDGWYSMETSFNIITNSKRLMESALSVMSDVDKSLFHLPAPCFSSWMVTELTDLLCHGKIISSVSADEFCNFLNLTSTLNFKIFQPTYFGHVLYSLKPIAGENGTFWFKQVRDMACLGESTGRSANSLHKNEKLENKIPNEIDVQIQNELERILQEYENFVSCK